MKIVWLTGFLWLVTACSKEVCEKPSGSLGMRYIALHDTAIAFGRAAAFDLDSNGTKDVSFGTRLVGDPLHQADKKQWLVSTAFDVSIPVSIDEETPMMVKNEILPLANFAGYQWYNASSVILVQQVITYNQPPAWQGNWLQANHHYLPVQLLRNDLRYNGWIETSFDEPGEKIILHKAAISRRGEQTILAGQ